MTAQHASSPPIAKKEPSPLMRFFANPIVGILGALASIIGVPLAIYFYVQATHFREVVYYVNPAQAIVVKSGEVSRLRVLVGDRELKSDVTTAQIAIWNRGNESLKQENMLTPLTIRTIPAVPILEVKIRTRSRDAIGMAIDETHLEDGTVGISWKILEQGDGGVIQLVYAGSPDKTKIALAGVIEGQREIHQLQYSGTILSIAEQVRVQHRFVYFAWLLVAISVLSLAFTIFLWREEPRRFNWVALLASVFLLAVSIYVFITSRVPDPPFGF